MAAFDWTFANENPVDDLLEIIKVENPELAKLIKDDKVLLGAPAKVNPSEDTHMKNTSINLTARLSCDFPGTTTIFYNRLPIGLTESSDGTVTGSEDSFYLYTSVGAEKNDANTSVLSNTDRADVENLMEQVPLKAVFNGGVANPKNYVADFELSTTTFTKNTPVKLFTSANSLRYEEGSYITYYPIIGDPSLLAMFPTSAISPFFQNKATKELKVTVKKVSGYDGPNVWNEAHYKAKLRFKEVCTFGLDGTPLMELGLIPSAVSYLNSVPEDVLVYLQKHILQPNNISLPSTVPAEYPADFTIHYTTSYRPWNYLGLPAKEGFNIGLIQIWGKGVVAGKSLTILNDDANTPTKFLELGYIETAGIECAQGSLHSILIPYYYK